jgi:hypothetical protein
VRMGGGCACSIFGSRGSGRQEWVPRMGTPLETIFICYNILLDSILRFRVSNGDSLIHLKWGGVCLLHDTLLWVVGMWHACARGPVWLTHITDSFWTTTMS